MEKVKSFWGRTGLIYMALGIFVTIVGVPFFVFDIRFLSWGVSGVSVIVWTAWSIGMFTLGLIWFVVGKYGDAKLKRLKEIGKAWVPAKTVMLPSLLSTHSFTGDTYKAFRVECTLRNTKGKEIVVKSRKMAVCTGLFTIIPQSAQTMCEAIVYVNPNKPYDFAVEVSIC